MTDLDLYYIGTFKRGEIRYTENPLKEVWSDIEHLGTKEFLESLEPDNKEIDWNQHCNYASVRISQALEYRIAAKHATVLTAPLGYYYSLLNLVRAAISIKAEIIPESQHGLRFKKDDILMNNGAELTSGTFKDYLRVLGVNKEKINFNLKECLSRIPELGEAFSKTTYGPSSVVPVIVKGKYSGLITLHFNSKTLNGIRFEEKWREMFPKLSSICKLDDSNKYALTTKVNNPDDTYTAICEFCEKYLIPDLTKTDIAIWYLQREDLGDIILPREAYYLAAMYILSNVVRYEPDIIAHAVKRDSEDRWLLKRFIETTDRFFPQLIEIWMRGCMIRY